MTGRPVPQLTVFQATCHQGSLIVMGGVQLWDDETDKPCQKHADTVLSISPHYTSPADDEADTSSKRFALGSDLRDLL